MKHLLTFGTIVGLIAIASLTVTADGKWAFNHDTGEGKIDKPSVVRALGYDVSYEEAQSLVFSSVDSIDGCQRQRNLNTMVSHTGGDGKRNPRVVGFYAFGYASSASACGSSGAAGTDATLYVNGVPIQ